LPIGQTRFPRLRMIDYWAKPPAKPAERFAYWTRAACGQNSSLTNWRLLAAE